MPDLKQPARSRFDNDLRYRDADDPRQTAITPPYLIEPLRTAIGWIGLDPCTTPDNPLNADRFYAPPTDGLAEPWDSSSIYCNPPYGKAREPWVERCIFEAWGTQKRIALLIPAATDTKVFQHAASFATNILFVRGRLKFGVLRPNRRQAAASHPSALLLYHVDNLAPLYPLGLVVPGGMGDPPF